ncbi:uncharacterized protein LOC110656172 [Hevea brasiliensis]|uniref:uncharacterized protein LOC110656172 n=1 Tax=Hevea brasiliensis TaxID=3981 RepID=UPI0025E00771|nr:uncharacterized protein LOC110656172 [Hevea brasiliensis]
MKCFEQNYFDWQEVTPLVKEAWRRKAAERYKALMCNVRKGKSKGELGLPSLDTTGFISHATHADRMEAKLGRRPFPYELFHKTHTRKGTSDMVDSRAQSIKDAFLALKEQSSQPQEGCNDPPIVDEVALYYQVVGGEKKNRVYGIGSQASIFYPSSSHGSSSTASYCAQSEAMEEEIQQLHQTVATLKDSLVAMEERDRQRELMLEERYRQREQTLEERMQQMMQNMMAQMMQSTQFTAPTPDATHQDDGREADSGDE